MTDDLYMSNDEALKVGDITPSRFSFVHDGQEVMAFGLDGTITVSPDIKADDAAKAVIESLLNMWPSVLTEARAQGAADERERLAKSGRGLDIYRDTRGNAARREFAKSEHIAELPDWLRSQKDTAQDKAD